MHYQKPHDSLCISLFQIIFFSSVFELIRFSITATLSEYSNANSILMEFIHTNTQIKTHKYTSLIGMRHDKKKKLNKEEEEN